MNPNKTEAFYYYLKAEGFKERTIQEHIQNLQHFMNWAGDKGLTRIAHIQHSELLSYVQHLKSRNLSIDTVNIHINSLRKYYEHLKQEGIIEHNPIKRLHVKGRIKKVVEDTFTKEELEALYGAYIIYIDNKKLREEKQRFTILRKKVILGLLIFQAVNGGELTAMEVGHINLQNAVAYIPSTSKGQSRILPLNRQQILILNTYLNAIPAAQIKLFDCSVRNLLAALTDELKGVNGRVRNTWHIRASVILSWLKEYNKRQVQYMIGHKWISSTEHYEQQELEGLVDLLGKHHPFG